MIILVDIPTYTGTEYPWLMNWLKSVQSEVSYTTICLFSVTITIIICTQQFYDLFAKEGYTEEWYVSGMTKKVSCLLQTL